MRIKDCPNAPQWLRDANVSDENVEVLESGYVIWYGGNWLGGDWRGGNWRGHPARCSPVSINGLRWAIELSESHMKIGCQLHSFEEWAAFTDDEIIAMDGRNALRFWRDSKAAIFAIARAAGRDVQDLEALK